MNDLKDISKDDLDLKVKISYQKLADYPIALEEITLTRLGTRYLLATSGFNTGGTTALYSAKDVYKARLKNGQVGSAAKKYQRGFNNTAYLYDLNLNQWSQIDSFPGRERQGSRAISWSDSVLGDFAFVWGGFSYQPAPEKINKLQSNQWPIKVMFQTYRDGYVLKLNPDHPTQSRWSRLPDLPIDLSNFCLASDGSYFWLCCGGTHLLDVYSGKIDVCNEKGLPLGQDLFRIKISGLLNLVSSDLMGWEKVAVFPGTPRVNAASCLVNDSLYVLGGIHPNFTWLYARRFEVDRYYTVVDNWKYDFKTGRWSELLMTPYGNGNFGSQQFNLWKNRYVVLLGGGYFKNSKYKNQVRSSIHYPPMEEAIRKKIVVADELKMRIALIYDLELNRWHQDYELFNLFNWTNLPSYVVMDDSVFILAGEQIPIVMDGQIYGLHSDLFLQGRLDNFF